MPTARSIASRAIAKTSGIKSVALSPSATRLRNSAVFAYSSASVNALVSASRLETCSTNFKYRLTIRSLRLPNTLRPTELITGTPMRHLLFMN